MWNKGQKWPKYQAVLEIHKLRKYAEEIVAQKIVKYGSEEYHTECFCWNTGKTEKVPLSSVKLSSVSTEENRSTRTKFLPELKTILNNKEQFICFLSGASGTGKS